MKREVLTYAEIASALRHDRGRLYWLISSGGVRIGAEAGRVNKDGYRCLRYKDRDLLAHRVVWILEHREWPVGQLDHIDRDPTNNDPSNLRRCTAAQNSMNRRSSGATGLKGVTLHRQTGQYQAQIQKNYIGLYPTPGMAAQAYDAEAIRRFGEFANLNGS